MSIRTNTMKAVPSLLRRLATIEKRAYNLEDLKCELINVKELFTMIKKIEEEVFDTLTMMDGYHRNFNLPKLMEEKEDICKRIKNSTQKLLPVDIIQRVESSDRTFQHVDSVNRKNINLTPFLFRNQYREVRIFNFGYDNLNPTSKPLFLSLLHLPENFVIKKTTTIFWSKSLYVGGFKKFEKVFDYLQSYKLIVPHGNDKCPIVNKFKINPCIHHVGVWPFLQKDIDDHYAYVKGVCLALDQRKVKLSDEFGSESKPRIVLNVSASHLDFGSQWMAKRKQLSMLHLGRLQDSSSHHIEVKREEFLKELRDQKHLKYLSLRGISGIFALPPSILEHENLQILDLKACHNLETLPDDISSLRKLIHLDMSQCYLLEKMPKGIEKLTNLKVLKGFVIGSSNKTPCRISDLANLENLERLNIHIGNEAIIQDREFESLQELSALKQLKISWGGSGTSILIFQ